MSKRWMVGAAVFVPLFLAGCSALPGLQLAAPTQTPSPQIAQIVPTGVATIMRTPTLHRTALPGTSSLNPPNTATSTPTIPTATPSHTPTPLPTAIPTPVILAPAHLGEAEVGGSVLYPRYWTHAGAIAFTMAVAPGTAPGMRPEVELEPVNHPFAGVPTAIGARILPGQMGTVTVQVSTLPEGAYRWQARLADNHGDAGPWAVYYQGPAFRLVRTPPAAPVVTSPTQPNQHAIYSAPLAQLDWTVPPAKGAIQGYQTGVDRNPHGQPSGTLQTATKTVIGPLANGTIYFHVRAVDYAGNMGAVATYVLHIDHRAPSLAHVYFDRFQFNPQFDHLTMHFVPSQTVQATAYVRQQSSQGIVRILSLGTLPAGKQATVSWDGRDARGVPVNTGLYTVQIDMKDQLGNVGDAIYTDLGVNYRRIVVHLGSQQIDVYDGSTLVRSSLVTTGNRYLPTPMGIWHVAAKFHPYSFISPWPKSSPFWYPTSGVNYALYFHTGGYFIHDAPWRTIFGPGTNASPGLPESGVYAGSHGCVETPFQFAQWLYNWAPIGTVVEVVQ